MQYYPINGKNPQPRILRIASKTLHAGELVILATDASFVLAATICNQAAINIIKRIRALDKNHHFTLLCADISQASRYAIIDNSRFHIIKHLTPGPYTFILNSRHKTPKHAQHRKKTIGIRIPNQTYLRMLLSDQSEPLLCSTLILAGEKEPLADPLEIDRKLRGTVSLIIDTGDCDRGPTTVLNMIENYPTVVRAGIGTTDFIEP